MRKPWLAAVALTLALTSPVLAQDTLIARATLGGLAGVRVAVEPIDSEAEKDGFARYALQADVELRLQQGGIRVLTETERLRMPGSPVLYLRAKTFTHGEIEGLYAYCIDLELGQTVRLSRDPTVSSWPPTWRSPGALGVAGARNLASVRNAVQDMVDQFINAYLAANPKR